MMGFVGVHETTQIVESGHCSCPEDGKGDVRAVGESSVEEQKGKLAGKWGSFELMGESSSPWLWVELNPFNKERKSGGTDVVDGVFRLVFSSWRGAATKGCDPETEGMSGVRWFRGFSIDCEGGDQEESCDDATEEKGSPFSHGDTVQRKEVDERAN